MNLNDWIKLDETTQRKLAAKWVHGDDATSPQPWILSGLVKEAAHRLAQQLVTVSEVTGVTGVISNGGEILVTTTLPRTAKLPHVPSRYAGFHVLQFGVAEMKKAYLKEVEVVFGASALPEDVVRGHVQFFQEELRDIHTPYYCDTPHKWIAELLSEAKSKGKGGAQVLKLRIAIQDRLHAIFANKDPAVVSSDEEAMSHLRNALMEIFAAHGV